MSSRVSESSFPKNKPMTARDFSLDSNPCIMYVKNTRILKFPLFSVIRFSLSLCEKRSSNIGLEFTLEVKICNRLQYYLDQWKFFFTSDQRLFLYWPSLKGNGNFHRNRRSEQLNSVWVMREYIKHSIKTCLSWSFSFCLYYLCELFPFVWIWRHFHLPY